MLNKLSAISTAWAAQFREPYGEHWTPQHFKTPPNLPLQWTVNEEGMLCLDDIWICPVKQIDSPKLGDEIFVTPVSMELDLYDSFLTVIITKNFGEYAIAGVERTVFSRQRREREEAP